MTKKAKVYGSSLYDLAAEEALTDRILQDIQQLCAAFRDIPDYAKLMASPSVAKEERKQLAKEAWQGTLHRYTLNFLYLLIDNDMAGEFADCAEEYRALYDKGHNILEVTVVSAAALSEAALGKLAAAIEKKTGRQPRIQVRIDESLIGGMRLEAGGVAYDSSVSYHLQALRQLLQQNNN